MKKSELKSIINEVIKEIMTDDSKTPLYVEYVSEMPHEVPFMMGDKKYQFVQAKYPNGKQDIGVYAFAGDVVYGYEAFRQMHNLKESYHGAAGRNGKKGLPSIAAVIDNTVFPHSSEDVEEMAKKYHVNVYLVGDASFGTENLRSYRMVFSGEQGQLDAFVHGLAEENGIDLHDTKDAHKINEETTHGEIVRTLKWKDGVEIGLNAFDDPVGYKALGWQNSGITIPKTEDWRRFYVSRSGNEEKFVSPKLKVWYGVDSSG